MQALQQHLQSAETLADPMSSLKDVCDSVARFAAVMPEKEAMQKLKAESDKIFRKKLEEKQLHDLETVVASVTAIRTLSHDQVSNIEKAWFAGKDLLIVAKAEHAELCQTFTEEVLQALLEYMGACLVPAAGGPAIDVQSLAKSIAEELPRVCLGEVGREGRVLSKQQQRRDHAQKIFLSECSCLKRIRCSVGEPDPPEAPNLAARVPSFQVVAGASHIASASST